MVDPTVVIGALLEPKGPCAALLERVARREVQLVLDDPVQEGLALALADRLVQEQGGWQDRDATRWMNALEILAVYEGTNSGGVSEAAAAAVKGPDRPFFCLAQRTASVLVSTDPDTLKLSGILGVDVLRPGTVNDVLSVRSSGVRTSNVA